MNENCHCYLKRLQIKSHKQKNTRKKNYETKEQQDVKLYHKNYKTRENCHAKEL